MSTRYVAFNERTGNPVADNRARQCNTQLSRYIRTIGVQTPRGRRRKKQLRTALATDIIRLTIVLMYELAHPHVTPTENGENTHE